MREAAWKNCEEKLEDVTGIEEKIVRKVPRPSIRIQAAERKDNLYDEIICSSFNPLFPFDLRRLVFDA